MPVQASHVYISAAINRANHVADWANAPHSTLAYASHKSIAIWSRPASSESPLVTQLIQTRFSKPVSCLKYNASLISAQAPLNNPSLVAGSADGTVSIWRTAHGDHWYPSTSIKDAHIGSVSAIGVLRPSAAAQSSSSLPFEILVTGASDSTLKVWAITPSTHLGQPDHVKLLQTIDLKSRFPLDISLISLPSSQAHNTSLGASPSILMALATTTRKIDIYAFQDDSTFSHKLSLEGHEDWVKSLDFCDTGISEHDQFTQSVVMLASGSQDGSVRLWKFAIQSNQSATHSPANPSDEFERIVSKIQADLSTNDGEISTRAHNFDLHKDGRVQQRWSVTFDALLVGHDNWVTGVRWHPPVSSSSPLGAQPAALLTSSADNSLILWTPTGAARDPQALTTFPCFNRSLISTGGAQKSKGPSQHHLASSIWLSSQRFGEVGGASNLGFFGALWRPSATTSNERVDHVESVMAHGWGGSAHVWTLQGSSDALSSSWNVSPPVTGHFGPAKGVGWEPNGEYFLSCSEDQTTRLHARLPPSTDTQAGVWHEIARPQSHGYDLHSVAWLDRLNFASAADEKIIRVFAAPQGFVGSVGPRGLNCATIGSEAESRLGLQGTPSLSHLLVMSDDEVGSLTTCAARHGQLVRQAAEKVLDDVHAGLLALVVSDKFNDSAEQSGYSFSQIENYLKWMYAQAWSVAIQKGRLLADINILLVPANRFGPVAQRVFQHACSISIEDESVQQLGPSLDNAQVRYQTLSIDRESYTDYSMASQDDGKGIKTYRVVALGGTFDHLHVGHKILLSMAALIAKEKIIVGVTDDAMLTKKSNAHLLESLEDRIASVNAFISLFRLPFTELNQNVVQLSDVAGPAGTEADIQALVVTDETLSGADFINKMRQDKGLNALENWTIGVLGSEGETDLKGDAKALADSKIGSTAIRKWLSAGGPRRAHALAALCQTRRRMLQSLLKQGDSATEASSNIDARPVGASVPPLGLSNRAVFEGTVIEEGPSESGQPIGKARESLSAVLKSAPTEEQLSVETLWPELEKLYGHGYELLWLAANPCNGLNQDGGRFVASCCRATNEEHAVVRIHDRKRNWMELGSLPGHSLSITRVKWSHDSRFLLSCSRDRSWRIFEKKDLGQDQVDFVPISGERSHARIIWDAAWSQDASDLHIFATGSRDKSFKVWRLLDSPEDGRPHKLLQTVKTNEAVTAIAFGVGGLLAVGLENGSVEVYSKQQPDEDQWIRRLTLAEHAAEQINQLEFRPPVLDDGDDALLLSAAEDGTVRVVRLSGL